MTKYTAVVPLCSLTINDSYLFAQGLSVSDDGTMSMTARGVDISYWWNKGNNQLVVRNLNTDELFTFEDIEEVDGLARAILLSWFYIDKAMR